MAEKYLKPGERLGDLNVTNKPRYNPPLHGGGGPAYLQPHRLGDTNVPPSPRFHVTTRGNGGPAYHKPYKLGQLPDINPSVRFKTGK